MVITDAPRSSRNFDELGKHPTVDRQLVAERATDRQIVID